MKHNREDDYRISDENLQSFLRRSGELSSDDHFAADDPPIDADRHADTEHLLALLDEAASAPVTTPPGNDDTLAPVAAPLGDDEDHLTDDDQAAVAELEDVARRRAAAYAPLSKFDDCEEITDPEALKKLHERSRFLREYAARDCAKKSTKKDYWEKVFDQARARYRAPERQAKADARRALDVVRKREKRAGQETQKRIAALERATANHGGNHSLVKLVGQERDLAVFRQAISAAHEQHGPKVSLPKIAAIWSAMIGATKSKQQAKRKRDIVKKLEAKGGAWYRWRAR